MELTKKCEFCATTFAKKKYTSLKDWETKCNFCSKKCWYDYRKKNKPYDSPLKGKTKRNHEGLNSISEKMKGNSNIKNYLAKGNIHHMKGRKLPKKWCENISKGNKGKKHWNWKNGKTDETHLLRKHREYQQWRIKVLERDNYICQKCGNEKDRMISAHHIKNFNDYPKLRYNVSNGITLCNSCHTKLHLKLRT